MNKFLFLKKLNKEFRKYNDDFKLEICYFFSAQELKKDFIQEKFTQINSSNINNIDKYIELKKQL
jgi:hypothetical protein